MNRWLRIAGSISILIVIIGSLLAAGGTGDKQTTGGEADMTLVKRGEYLVTFGGCNDCHTPKVFTARGMQLDESRLLSGHPQDAKLPELNASMIGPDKWLLMNSDLTAAAGPWGVSFAANLTPDDQTGIGLWQEENFINAMRTGKHMGEGRPILPPMPWNGVSTLSDQDLKAIFAYLKSLKPVRNRVPAPIPPEDLAKK